MYEAFAPYGVALLIETATDNTTRTVANMRMHLNRGNGTFSTSGSVSFLFERKGLFKFPKNNHDLEELELELIDFGLIEIMKTMAMFLFTRHSKILVKCQKPSKTKA